MLIYDKKYRYILTAYDLLSILSANKETTIEIKRTYIDDENIKINFIIFDKRYLLVVPTDSRIGLQIWHSHNKTNSLVKEEYNSTDIVLGKFIKE